MKLTHLLTATAAVFALSLPVYAANDAADADMDAKASMPQKMDSKMMQKNDMKGMKNADMKEASNKDSSMNMKEAANKEAPMMNDSSMNVKDAAMKMEMININTADAATIAKAKLKGISMKKAEAIVAYREKNGNFQSIDDLANVKGISKKIIAKNKDRLTTG